MSAFSSFSAVKKWLKKDSALRSILPGRADKAQFTACNVLGKPVWSPRNYEALVKIGYQENVIVYRCVNLIATSLSNIPIKLLEHRPEGDVEIRIHPTLSLLRNPNAKQSQCSFFRDLFSQLMLSGNAFIKASANGQNVAPAEKFPTALKVLRSDRVRILLDDEGHQAGFEYTKGTHKKVFPFDRKTGQSAILHIKLFHPLNDWYGMSPLEAAAQSIDQHNAVAAHNLAILQNGGRPTGALILRSLTNGVLQSHQREELRRDFNGLYSGAENAGKILILEGNCEWKEMGLSPKDLDFNSGRQAAAREIAQAFGIPPIMIGMTEDATYTNYREARKHMWEDTLLPLLDLVLGNIGRFLL